MYSSNNKRNKKQETKQIILIFLAAVMIGVVAHLASAFLLNLGFIGCVIAFILAGFCIYKCIEYIKETCRRN